MIEFIAANYVTILAAILGTQALAQLVVNLTPTPRDDVWVGKVYRAVEVVAGIVSQRAKEQPPNRVAETASTVATVATAVGSVARAVQK